MIAVLVPVFLLLLISGLPIFLTMGLATMITLALASPIPIIMVPEVMFNSLGGFTLLAIPFFTIAAQFMAKGGSSKYLIEAANCWVGHRSGGLAIVCVLSGMFFGAICGSSVASALALGVIVVPAMVSRGYSPSFSTGVVACSGTLAIMIPPSVTMILYGILTDQSIPRLFLGGFIPGIMEGLLYMIWIHFYSRRMGYRGEKKATARETLQATVKAIPAFALAAVILGSIYSGIFTITETSALAAGVAIFIALFIYREVKLREIFSVTADAMKSSGMIMIIIATALAFGNLVTTSGVTSNLVSFVHDIKLPAWAFLFLVNVIFIILGMFLEVASILFITVPVLFPVVVALGINPIHFGVMMVANMELALLTPPVGLNLYVLSGVTKIPINEVIRGTFPFIILQTLAVFILAYFPSIILFLPNLVLGK
jgi:C4-dicarboxylate transporter, DctM subunit